jgi:cholesterol oxidase
MPVPLEITEWMKGYVGFGATDSDAGYIQGLTENTPFSHEIVIRIDDIDRFVVEPTHAAPVDGHVDCPRFGGKCAFTGGMFNMLVDTATPGLKVMLYRMPFVDLSGARHTMLGHKTVRSDRALDLLNDIMRLTVRIFEGDVRGPAVGTAQLGPAEMPATPEAIGILHIQTLDGLRSGASFKSPGASPLEAASAAAKFGAFYLGELWDTYGPRSSA